MPIERTFTAAVTLPDDWMDPELTEAEEWANLQIELAVRLRRAWHMATPSFQFIEWASEPELTKAGRRIVDTADLHEQAAYEDTQSLSAPEAL